MMRNYQNLIYTIFSMCSCFQWEGLWAFFAHMIRFESGATHGYNEIKKGGVEILFTVEFTVTFKK